jgi:maltose-binding protein MalE
MLKKLILSMLMLSMLLMTFVGCFGEKETETQDTESDSTQSTTNADPNADTFEEYDFNEEEFTILTRTETKYEFSGAGLAGDTIDRAVYQRNHQVQERFNVSLKVVDKTGGWDQRNDFLAIVRAEAMGGQGGYDMVSTHSVYLGWMTVEGLATDMSTLPEMDFTKSWWNQNLYEEVNINGHVYFMLGDICTTKLLVSCIDPTR